MKLSLHQVESYKSFAILAGRAAEVRADGAAWGSEAPGAH